jgi:hypothetical protein
LLVSTARSKAKGALVNPSHRFYPAKRTLSADLGMPVLGQIALDPENKELL